MTIKIFNDEPQMTGRYIFPVFTTGGKLSRDLWLQAFFAVPRNQEGTRVYARTKLRRIYINPDTGIAPGQHVTVQIPLLTTLTGGDGTSPDGYIDWWNGDTIQLFFSNDGTGSVPRALNDDLNFRTIGCNTSPPGACQTPLTETTVGLPTCVENGCVLKFYNDFADLPKSDPSQLIEFTLGALQATNDLNQPTNVLDLANVDFDVSYVNVAYGPAALAPFNNDQVGYVGTPVTYETFSTALNNFLQSPTGKGWPQFVRTYSDGQNPPSETILKLASPLEIFSRLTNSNAQPDLNCTPAAPQSCSWPTSLWPPIKSLFDNWLAFAGTTSTSPGGKCIASASNTLSSGASPFCTALNDVKNLIIANYNKYVTLNPGCPHVSLTVQGIVKHVYQFSPWVESTGTDACVDPGANLLADTPGYADNDHAKYAAVKLEFDRLNYNQLYTGNPLTSYIFNPWVGCQASDAGCNFPNGLIHGSNFVNAPNVYAYSVDDAVGNIQAEGTGFIIDVGSTKNLCTGPAPCPNQNLAVPPISINAPGFNPSGVNFTNYGVCELNINNAGLTYKPVNKLNPNFVISANDPSKCPIFFVDSNNKLYTFKITTAPAKIPPPFSLTTTVSPQTAGVIDCNGNRNPLPPGSVPPPNSSFTHLSKIWCCQLFPSFNNGVWAHSQANNADVHKRFDHIVTTNSPNQNDVGDPCTCGGLPVGSTCPPQ